MKCKSSLFRWVEAHVILYLDDEGNLIQIYYSQAICIVMKNNGHNHPDFKQAQTTIEFLLGPIKIKDGLFMGDQLAARDIEFIVTNKVTHVINTVSKAVPNLYQRFGVQYLSVHWTEKQENIFDKKNNAINAIYTFIEQAMEQGQSCLIHSLHGKSRSCAVLVAYLMKKYSWSLNKSLELINNKKEGLEIRSNYLAQMQDLENRMLQNCKLSYTWTDNKNEEDQLLSNTFNNSKKAAKVEANTNKKSNYKRISWDEKPVQKYAATSSTNMSLTMTNKNGLRPKDVKIKSILKGFPNEEQPNQPKTQAKEKSDNVNLVGLTVNNFMQTQKKVEQNNQYFNTRPFSSDNKDRQKKTNPYELKTNKLFGYDASSKNVYQNKIISKIGVGSTSNKNSKKIQEPKKVVIGNDRPQSANIVPQRKKVKNQFPYGQDLIVTNNIGKKRYPSTNAREDVIRLK